MLHLATTLLHLFQSACFCYKCVSPCCNFEAYQPYLQSPKRNPLLHLHNNAVKIAAIVTVAPHTAIIAVFLPVIFLFLQISVINIVIFCIASTSPVFSPFPDKIKGEPISDSPYILVIAIHGYNISFRNLVFRFKNTKYLLSSEIYFFL